MINRSLFVFIPIYYYYYYFFFGILKFVPDLSQQPGKNTSYWMSAK